MTVLRRVVLAIARVFLRIQVWRYQRSDGRRAGSLAGIPLRLLITTGRKSGVERTLPLGYVHDGEHLVICGSHNGSDHPPAWALNLQANPSATVQLKADKFPVTAVEVVGDDYEPAWARFVQAYPRYAGYRKKTQRHIPLFSLVRQG